jgi:hypothetical protein
LKKNQKIFNFFLGMTGISLRKVEPQQTRSYNQGDLMREIREGKFNAKFVQMV